MACLDLVPVRWNGERQAGHQVAQSRRDPHLVHVRQQLDLRRKDLAQRQVLLLLGIGAARVAELLDSQAGGFVLGALDLAECSGARVFEFHGVGELSVPIGRAGDRARVLAANVESLVNLCTPRLHLCAQCAVLGDALHNVHLIVSFWLKSRWAKKNVAYYGTFIKNVQAIKGVGYGTIDSNYEYREKYGRHCQPGEAPWIYLPRF